MAKKTRTYEDYAELGNLYLVALRAMMDANCLMSQLFGKRKDITLASRKVYQSLDKMRYKLDDWYCRDIPESAVPKGSALFPLYNSRRAIDLQNNAEGIAENQETPSNNDASTVESCNPVEEHELVESA